MARQVRLYVMKSVEKPYFITLDRMTTMDLKRLTLGILAHVDAGKTTLSEAILYHTGSIRKMGRVDHQDAFLDTFELEKARGITIFSKQAMFGLGDYEMTLLDTPGHVDFSSEMERTLKVLDYAILVISGSDGVQGHTRTLWKLLERYQIPTFIFVNKMDQEGTDEATIFPKLRGNLSDRIVNFSDKESLEVRDENIAVNDEELMEQYLESGLLTDHQIRGLIAKRKIFPVFFGSALKDRGIDRFIESMGRLMMVRSYPEAFGAKVFKISRDDQGNRLTHMKITGGSLKVKEELQGTNGEHVWQDKVDQIRLYSGKQYELAQEVSAGTICAVTGLSRTLSGEGLGNQSSDMEVVLSPVLNYRILLPEGANLPMVLTWLRQLEEEEPHLNIVWHEKLMEIHAQVMGEVEMEILKSMIKDRYDLEIDFEAGSLMYKETIDESVIGIGHFEPLRHYAEAHILMEPLPKGSGLVYASNCSEDLLARNWQRLILSHLKERKHLGVLSGSEIIDIKMTVIAGRAHLKHTEGGDFRQATYRAVRQGLMKARSILLEPVYDFRLEMPSAYIGRAMSDVQRMSGRHGEPSLEGDMAILTGVSPVATMMHYAMEVVAYTKGTGKLTLSHGGYEPCHNTEEVLERMAYDPLLDFDHPLDSVFCAKGTGYVVPWDQVDQQCHVENGWTLPGMTISPIKEQEIAAKAAKKVTSITDKEIEAIFQKTFGPSKRDNLRSSNETTYFTNQADYGDQSKSKTQNALDEGKKNTPASGATKDRSSKHAEAHKKAGHKARKSSETREQYLLVDGYNLIHAWDELQSLSEDQLGMARAALLEILSDYQGHSGESVMVIFDGYKVIGNPGTVENYHNVTVVYTKEAETADHYIERLVEEIGRNVDVVVVSSDAIIQTLVLAKGATRLSAREFKDHLAYHRSLNAQRHQGGIPETNRLENHLSPEMRGILEALRRM